MTAPILGYLDPDFITIMDGVASMLRHIFGTKTGFTLPISGTGSAGMEAGLSNLLEPEDTAVILDNGFFGERMVEIANRQRANVIRVSADWGTPVDPDLLEAELRQHKQIKLVAAVHAETSTGVLQPMADLAKIAHSYNALFMVDAVTSLAGNPVEMDKTGIDFCYSATQKCLGAPPGLSPVALSEMALEALSSRRTKPMSWYLDLGLLRDYWQGGTRVYHHTAPVSMIYALREALRIVSEETLEFRFDRHERNGKALRAGLRALGLTLMVPDQICTYQLTSVQVPDNIDDVILRTRLLKEFNIEIGGGLGRFKGKVWRIGLMGESSRVANVLLLLSALETLLPQMGYEVTAGSGISAANAKLM